MTDPRLTIPTEDLLHAAMQRQLVAGYRAAAAELLERAEQMEREARQVGEVANLIEQADAELVSRRRPRRGVA